VRKKLGLPSPFDIRLGNPLDLHAIALSYPQMPIIIPHFGAGLFREALMVADLCPNVLLDTSSSNGWIKYVGLSLPAVFRQALAVVGAERLLFGSDSSFFPRGWVGDVHAHQSAALDEIGAPPTRAAESAANPTVFPAQALAPAPRAVSLRVLAGPAEVVEVAHRNGSRFVVLVLSADETSGPDPVV
jgi:hypothetical protein